MPNGLNPLPFLTSTFSASLLLLSCHSAPDERLLKIVAEKKQGSPPKPPVVATTTAKPKKKIYLTFDDGPNKGTDSVLAILQEEQVPATLFVIGEQVYGSKAQSHTWQQLQQCGFIELCNHSYTHAHNQYARFYCDTTGVVADFVRCKDSLRLNNFVARTPGRNIWRIDNVSVTDIDKTKPAADAVQRNGFILVGWDVEWHYTPPNLLLREPADTILQRIDSMLTNNLTQYKDHIVLLAHDQTFEDPRDAASLRRLLQLLKKRDDYSLEKISSYPGVSQ